MLEPGNRQSCGVAVSLGTASESSCQSWLQMAAALLLVGYTAAQAEAVIWTSLSGPRREGVFIVSACGYRAVSKSVYSNSRGAMDRTAFQPVCQ